MYIYIIYNMILYNMLYIYYIYNMHKYIHIYFIVHVYVNHVQSNNTNTRTMCKICLKLIIRT